MMKLIKGLSSWKIYLIILVIGFGAGWTVHGWKTDAAKTSAMETMVDDHNKQSKKDGEQFKQDVKTIVKIKTVYKTIREEVNNVPDTPDNDCTVDPEYIRVWNRSIEAIGESLTRSLYDPLRVTIPNDHKEPERQNSG